MIAGFTGDLWAGTVDDWEVGFPPHTTQTLSRAAT